MVNLDAARLHASYDKGGLDAIRSSLDTLDQLGFIDYLVAENNRSVVESYQDLDADELAKKIIANRELNRVLLGLKALTTIIKREMDNA